MSAVVFVSTSVPVWDLGQIGWPSSVDEAAGFCRPPSPRSLSPRWQNHAGSPQNWKLRAFCCTGSPGAPVSGCPGSRQQGPKLGFCQPGAPRHTELNTATGQQGLDFPKSLPATRRNRVLFPPTPPPPPPECHAPTTPRIPRTIPHKKQTPPRKKARRGPFYFRFQGVSLCCSRPSHADDVEPVVGVNDLACHAAGKVRSQEQSDVAYFLLGDVAP